jgi:hypothetical protein
MRKLIWAIVVIALVIWSGLAWLIHSLVGFGGGLAANNADIVSNAPEAVEWLNWIALFGTGVGEWLVIGVWGLGAVALLILGFAGNTILRRFPGAMDKFNRMRTNT